MKTRIEKLQGFSSSTYVTLSVFLVIAILPFFILSAYIHPVADDLSYALKGDNFGQNLISDYNGWNSRYSSNVFVFLNFILARDVFVYRLYPVLLILGLAGSSYYFIATVFKKLLSQIEIAFYTLLFIAVTLIGLPDESEGLYWYTGSVTYVFPFVLFFVEAVLVIKFFKSEFVLNKFLHQAILFLLTIFLAGFSEVMGILLLFFSCGLFYLSRKNKLSNNLLPYIFLSASVVGLIAIGLAPGNSVRIQSYPGTQLLLHSLLYSTLQVGRFILEWITSPMLWVATLIYLPVAFRVNFSGENRIIRWVILSMLPLIIFCCVFPAYWGTGILGQHRTLNTAYIFFILLWFFSVHIFSNELRIFDLAFLFEKKGGAITLLIIFVLAILFTGNALTTWSDLLSGRAKEYDRQMSVREQSLKQCSASGKMNCSVPLLSVNPQSIFVLDLQKDSTDWFNDNYARFYGLKSVSVK